MPDCDKYTPWTTKSEKNVVYVSVQGYVKFLQTMVDIKAHSDNIDMFVRDQCSYRLQIITCRTYV